VTAQASQTRIVNRALTMLGSAQRISSISDPSGPAVTALALFDDARDATLVDHPWNFAIRRASLAADAKPPEFGWDYAFTLPSDCLRWLPPSRDGGHWFRGEQEGNALLADTPGPLPIRYIARIEDVAAWSAGFTEALAWKLATEMEEAITGQRSNAPGGGYDMALRKAKRADGLTTGDRSRNMVTTSNWVRTRGDGSNTDWYYGPARGARPDEV
jgi:hypothetical protein